jgi:hypothetical protein
VDAGGAVPADAGAGGVAAVADLATPTRPGVVDGVSADPGADGAEVPAVPRAGLGADAAGGGELGVLSRGVTGSGGRDWTVLVDLLHGTKDDRLRGNSPPNQLATEGPTSSPRTSRRPTPSAIRNHRALKMLGRRRMRCDTSDLTRLILEFPKYGRMLASQC